MCLANEWSLEGIFVANLNVHLMSEHIGFNLHKLECPVRVFTAVVADLRSPLLAIYSDPDEGIHFV